MTLAIGKATQITPRPKRETKEEETKPGFATRVSIKAGTHVHTAEVEYSRSARSTAKDESANQSDADEELAPGNEDEDEDEETTTPLVTLKPNRRQDGHREGITGSVVSDGLITRTCQLPSEMSAGAGDRASNGSPHLSFDGSRIGAPGNSHQSSSTNGSEYGIKTPTSSRGATPQYGRTAHQIDIRTPTAAGSAE